MVHFSADGRPPAHSHPAYRSPTSTACGSGGWCCPAAPVTGGSSTPGAGAPTAWATTGPGRKAAGGARCTPSQLTGRATNPALAGRIPFAIALVDLDEGPRLVGNMVDCDVADITVGMTVEAAYEDVDGVTLLVFKPLT